MRTHAGRSAALVIADPVGVGRLLPSSPGSALFLRDGCTVATAAADGSLVTVDPATRRPAPARPVHYLISPKSLVPGLYTTGPADGTVAVRHKDRPGADGLVIGSLQTGAADIVKLRVQGEITAVLAWLDS